MQNLNFEKLTTKTGVPLYVMSLPHVNTVAAGVLVKAGTRDEQWPKEAGLAHALEHIVFHGTKNFATSKEVSAYIEEIGGILNAWTWSENTFFWNQVPEKYKERSVSICSELVNNPKIPTEKIPTEMSNIVEEIRRANDDPAQFTAMLSQKFLYGEHPLGKNTLGTEKSVKSFTRDHFLAFRKRLYDPVNYTFIIAGAITSEEALLLFEKNFPQNATLKENIRSLVEINDSGERKFIYKKQLEQVHVSLSAPMGKSSEKSSRALDLFTTMLDGGMSFPLFQEVRDKKGLCYEINASVVKFSDVGTFDITIGTDPFRFQEAINTTLEVIDKSKGDAFLLQKAKDVELGRLALRYENTGSIINAAAMQIFQDGKPYGYKELAEEIEKINIEDVTQAVDRYLSPEQIRQVLLAPESLTMKA